MSVTDKVSITIARRELRDAKRLASRLGLSLSAFISDAVRERVAEQERREAGQAVLASFPPEDRATPAETAALLERWSAGGATAGRVAAAPRTPYGRVAGSGPSGVRAKRGGR
jgi:hypothetical protein